MSSETDLAELQDMLKTVLLLTSVNCEKILRLESYLEKQRLEIVELRNQLQSQEDEEYEPSEASHEDDCSLASEDTWSTELSEHSSDRDFIDDDSSSVEHSPVKRTRVDE